MRSLLKAQLLRLLRLWRSFHLSSGERLQQKSAALSCDHALHLRCFELGLFIEAVIRIEDCFIKLVESSLGSGTLLCHRRLPQSLYCL
jgi:hypothetical protein